MTIKIFDLRCEQGHVFEAWFSSEEDYESQMRTHAVSCPICGSTSLTKRLSAVHLAKHSSSSASNHEQTEESEKKLMAQLTTRLMAQVREAAVRAEDVGDRFCAEARAIEAGHAEKRPIKGRCSQENARELLEEGILVLPVPESSGKTLN